MVVRYFFNQILAAHSSIVRLLLLKIAWLLIGVHFRDLPLQKLLVLHMAQLDLLIESAHRCPAFAVLTSNLLLLFLQLVKDDLECVPRRYRQCCARRLLRMLLCLLA